MKQTRGNGHHSFFHCSGGSTLYIESSLRQPLSRRLDSDKETKDGSLQLTGHLGDVMKESAQIAYTVAKLFLAGTDPENRFLQSAHIHVHVPEVRFIFDILLFFIKLFCVVLFDMIYWLPVSVLFV